VRLAWGRVRSEPRTLEADADPEATPFELSAIDVYTLTGRQVGWLTTNGERTSDLLNRPGDIMVHGLTPVDPAADEVAPPSPLEADVHPLARDDVRFAVPSPLPPNRHLRLHRRRILIAVRMGPYEVSGQIHVRPGAAAGDYLLRSSRSFVPLTDVELVQLSDPPLRRLLPVVIINAAHVTEMINLERRARGARSDAQTAQTVSGPAAPASPTSSGGGPLASRIAQTRPSAGDPPAQPGRDVLGALQLLLDHGLIDPLEFQQKRAHLQSRPS
jgi:hypothetical protein